MMRRLIASGLLVTLSAALALAGVGCSKRHKISIQSDTSWLGTIDRESSTSFRDSGNATFRVAGELHCVTVLNLRDAGFVRVRIDDGAWVESAAPRGTAESCR